MHYLLLIFFKYINVSILSLISDNNNNLSRFRAVMMTLISSMTTPTTTIPRIAYWTSHETPLSWAKEKKVKTVPKVCNHGYLPRIITNEDQ